MDIWKSSFTQGVIKPWNALPRDEVELASLEVFKESLCHGVVDRVVFGYGIFDDVRALFQPD